MSYNKRPLKTKKCQYCGAEFKARTNRRYCSQYCAGIAGRYKKTTVDTICWNCKNATGGCSWSEDFTPVEGWKAKPTTLKVRSGKYINYVKSYVVRKCPKFVEG